MYLALALVLAVPLGFALYHAQFDTVPAPEFTLTSTGYENRTMGEPVTFSLSDARGKTVVLDMMAVTCTSCRLVTEQVLKPLYEAHADDPDFVMWSIDTWADPEAGVVSQFGETREELIKLQKEEGVAWRHALDTDDVWRKYNAISLPKVVVVDGEGRIVFAAHGMPDQERLEAVVEASLAGEADEVPVLQGGLFVLAFAAGVASFFSPCSVGLMPAYLGFLLRQEGGVRRIVGGGVATGAGIVAIYAVIAAGLFALARAGYAATARQHLPLIAPVIAGLLIVLGTMMFFQVSWDRLAVVLGMGRLDGRRGFFTFGLGYGLAAFGCTGPAFLPILLGGFLEGTATGLAVFAVYALAIVGFVVLAAILVASGNDGTLRRMLSKTRIITRTAAVLMIGAGAYLLYVERQAGLFG